MKKIFLYFFLAPLLSYTQIDSKDILFTIDDKPVTTAEFLRVYNKNSAVVTGLSSIVKRMSKRHR